MRCLIGTIGAGGVTTPVLLALALIACGRNPADPTTLPPSARMDFSGVWQGEYQVTGCSGDRSCGFSLGTTRTFLLRIYQTGERVGGVLTLTDGSYLNASIDLAGTVSADGLLMLAGSKSAASALDGSGEIQVTRLAIQRDLRAGLTGTLEYVARFTPQQNPQTNMIQWTGSVSRAQQVATSAQPLSFTGHWRGGYVLRRCVPVGWTYCNPPVDRLTIFELRLTQTGASVAGTAVIGAEAHPVPVTGSVVGTALMLEGWVDFGPQSSVTADILRLTAWSTAVDDIGHMQGSFSYVYETHWARGDVWTLSYDAELVTVVAVP